MTKEIIKMKGWIKESILLKKAQEFNGRIKTVKDLFEHMERLQKCTSCKRDFYDKWCLSCCIPKSILRKKIDKYILTEQNRVPKPECKILFKLKEDLGLLGEDFEEINHKAIVEDNKELESFKKALLQDVDEILGTCEVCRGNHGEWMHKGEFNKKFRELLDTNSAPKKSEKNAWGRTYFIFKDVALIYGFLAITLSLWGYLRAFILLRKELKNE